MAYLKPSILRPLFATIRYCNTIIKKSSFLNADRLRKKKKKKKARS